MATIGTSTKQYVKNIIKSTKYVAVETLKGLDSDLTSFVENNVDTVKEGIENAKNYKDKAKELIDKIRKGDKKDNIFYKLYKNALTDLKSGKFYNEEREQELIGGGDAFDFGDGSDINFDVDYSDNIDSDTDYSSTESNTKEKDKTETIADKINFGQRLSNIESASIIKDTSNSNTIANIEHNALLFSAVNKSLTAINASILNLHNDITNPLNSHITNISKFTETATSEIAKQTSYLEKIANILDNRFNLANKNEYSRRDRRAWDNVFSYGLPDVSEWIKHAIGRAKEEIISPQLSLALGLMDSDMMKTSMIDSILASPVSWLINFGLSAYFPQKLERQINRTKNIITSKFRELAFNFDKNKYNSGVFGFLSKIFNIVDTPNIERMDFSDYNKGTVDWTGKDSRALQHVLPLQLATIISILTGRPAKLYNYENGTWESSSELAYGFIERRKEAYERAGRDLQEDIIRDVIKEENRKAKERGETTVFSEQSQGIKAIQQTYQTIIQLMAQHNIDGFESPGEFITFLNELNMFDPNNPFKLDRSYASRIVRLIFKEKRTRMSQLKMAVYSGKIKDEAILRDAAQDSSIVDLLNNSDIDKSQNWFSQNKLLEDKDENGHNIFYYLSNILDTLQNHPYSLGTTNQSSSRKRKGKTSNANPASSDNTSRPPKTKVSYVDFKQLLIDNDIDIKNLDTRQKILDQADLLNVSLDNEDVIKILSNSILSNVIPTENASYARLSEMASRLGYNEKYMYRNNKRNPLALNWDKDADEATMLKQLEDLKKYDEDMFIGDIENAKASYDPKTGRIRKATGESTFLSGIFGTSSRGTRENNEGPIATIVSGFNDSLERVILGDEFTRIKNKYHDDGLLGAIKELPNSFKNAIYDPIKESFVKAWNMLKESKFGLKYLESLSNKAKSMFSGLINFVTGKPDSDYTSYDYDYSTAAKGGLVKKSGMVSVSEGEIIIPANKNKKYKGNLSDEEREEIEQDNLEKWEQDGSPGGEYFGSFAKGGKVGNKKHKKHKNYAGKVIQIDIGNAIEDKVNSLINDIEISNDSKLKNTINYATDKIKGSINAGRNIKDKVNSVIDKGNAIVKDPKLRESISYATNKIKDMIEKVLLHLIGDPEKIKNGKAIIKTIFEKIKPKLPEHAAQGTIGAIAGAALTGSPIGLLGGLIIGAGTSIIKDSDDLSKKIFGERDIKGRYKNGILPSKIANFIKIKLPRVAKAGLMGGLFGLTGLTPFGLFGNMIIGAGLEFISDTNFYKNIVYGKMGIDGKRHGGLISFLNKYILDPFKKFTGGLFSNIGTKLFNKVLSPFQKWIAKPFKKIQDILLNEFKIFSNFGKELFTATKREISVGFKYLKNKFINAGKKAMSWASNSAKRVWSKTKLGAKKLWDKSKPYVSKGVDFVKRNIDYYFPSASVNIEKYIEKIKEYSKKPWVRRAGLAASIGALKLGSTWGYPLSGALGYYYGLRPGLIKGTEYLKLLNMKAGDTSVSPDERSAYLNDIIGKLEEEKNNLGPINDTNRKSIKKIDDKIESIKQSVGYKLANLTPDELQQVANATNSEHIDQVKKDASLSQESLYTDISTMLRNKGIDVSDKLKNTILDKSSWESSKNTLDILKDIYDTDQTSYNKLTAEDYQTMVEKIKSTADANINKFKEARLNKKVLQDILGEDLAEDTRYFKFARQSKSDIIKHYLDMEKAADENSEDEENKQLESNINKIIDNQENSSNLDKKRNSILEQMANALNIIKDHFVNDNTTSTESAPDDATPVQQAVNNTTSTNTASTPDNTTPAQQNTNNNTSTNSTAAKGGLVKKSGMVSVSEGEIIIPANKNKKYKGNLSDEEREEIEQDNLEKWEQDGSPGGEYFGSFAKGGKVGKNYAGKVTPINFDQAVVGTKRIIPDEHGNLIEWVYNGTEWEKNTSDTGTKLAIEAEKKDREVDDAIIKISEILSKLNETDFIGGDSSKTTTNSSTSEKRGILSSIVSALPKLAVGAATTAGLFILGKFGIGSSFDPNMRKGMDLEARKAEAENENIFNAIFNGEKAFENAVTGRRMDTYNQDDFVSSYASEKIAKASAINLYRGYQNPRLTQTMGRSARKLFDNIFTNNRLTNSAFGKKFKLNTISKFAPIAESLTNPKALMDKVFTKLSNLFTQLFDIASRWLDRHGFIKGIALGVKNLIEKASNKLAGSLIGKMSKKAFQAILKFVPFLNIALVINDLSIGWQDATTKTVLGVLDEPSISEKIFSSVFYALMNFIPGINLIPTDFLFSCIYTALNYIFGITFGGLGERRKAAQKTIDEYNKQNGTTYNLEEYIYNVQGDHTVQSDLWKATKKTGSDIMYGLRTSGKWIAEKTKPVRNYIGDVVNSTFDKIDEAHKISSENQGFSNMLDPRVGTAHAVSIIDTSFTNTFPLSAMNKYTTRAAMRLINGNGERNSASIIPKDNTNQDSKNANLSGSGSDIHTTQKGNYNRFGNSTIDQIGCGPAVASTVLKSYGKNIDINDTADYASGNNYLNNNGTKASYFSDILGSQGIRTQYTNNKNSIESAINSGSPTILLGKDQSNKSKANSPFGPNPHYVVARGKDRNGHIIIDDPELQKTTTYNKNILNKTQLGIKTGGGVGELLSDSFSKIFGAIYNNLKGSDPTSAKLLGYIFGINNDDSSSSKSEEDNVGYNSSGDLPIKQIRAVEDLPKRGEKYFNLYSPSGISHGIPNTIYGSPTHPDYQSLSNCTGYAIGRFNHIYRLLSGDESRFFDFRGNAVDFYNCGKGNYNYDTGGGAYENIKRLGLETDPDIPQPGAIMVWSKEGGAGHVAIVEEVISQNEVVTSESGYGGIYNGSGYVPVVSYNRKRINGKWEPAFSGAYSFRGFIYNPAVKKYLNNNKNKKNVVSKAGTNNGPIDLSKVSQKNVSKFIWAYLLNMLLKKNFLGPNKIGSAKIWVASIMGNMYQESGLRTSAVNGISGAYGLCQWLGERMTYLNNYKKAHRHLSELEAQLGYLESELDGSANNGTYLYEKHQMSPWIYPNGPAAPSIEKATYIWCSKFERCDPSEAEHQNRVDNAKYYYNKYKDMEFPLKGSAALSSSNKKSGAGDLRNGVGRTVTGNINDPNTLQESPWKTKGEGSIHATRYKYGPGYIYTDNSDNRPDYLKQKYYFEPSEKDTQKGRIYKYYTGKENGVEFEALDNGVTIDRFKIIKDKKGKFIRKEKISSSKKVPTQSSTSNRKLELRAKGSGLMNELFKINSDITKSTGISSAIYSSMDNHFLSKLAKTKDPIYNIEGITSSLNAGRKQNKSINYPNIKFNAKSNIKNPIPTTYPQVNLTEITSYLKQISNNTKFNAILPEIIKILNQSLQTMSSMNNKSSNNQLNINMKKYNNLVQKAQSELEDYNHDIEKQIDTMRAKLTEISRMM